MLVLGKKPWGSRENESHTTTFVITKITVTIDRREKIWIWRSNEC